MNLKIIWMDFILNIKAWYRSKGGMFWSLAFPVILILLFGAIFSGIGSSKYTLYVQDQDKTEMSKMFNTTLNATNLFNINFIDTDVNVTSYIKEKSIKSLIVIPKGFEHTIQESFINPSARVDLIFYFDPSEQTTTQVIP